MALLPPDPVFIFNQREIGPINCLCFHHNDRLFAGTKKGQIHLFDLETKRSTFNMTVAENPLISIHLTDNFLLSMEKGGTLKLNQLTNSGYKMINKLQLDHTGFCRFDCNSQDNIVIAPKNDNSICIMALETLEEKQKFNDDLDNHVGIVSSIKYLNAHSQTYVLGGYDSGSLKLWDLRRPNSPLAKEQFNNYITSIDYDHVTNRGIIGSTCDKIDLFSINLKNLNITKKAELPIKNPGVHCVKIRKDLKVFVTGDFDGRIRVFSWKSLRPLAVLSEHKADLMDIAFSDGVVPFWKSKIMAAASSDNKITLWDIYN